MAIASSTVAAPLTRSISTAWRSPAGTRYQVKPQIYLKDILNSVSGLLVRVPALRAAVLCRLPQRRRAYPLLASSRRCPEPLLLQPGQGAPEHPDSTQRASLLHEQRDRPERQQRRQPEPRRRPRHRQASHRMRMLRRQRQYLSVRPQPPTPNTKPQSLPSHLTTPRAWQVCPNTIPTLAGADLWPIFFPSDQPNLYNSIPNWAWDTCDSTLSATNCKNIGFTDPSDKFYQPGNFPANGTSTLHNVAGTVTAPPSGTVITWSQSSTTYTVSATGYDAKAVASQSEYRATSTGDFPVQTANGAVSGSGIPAGGVVAALGFVGVLMVL